MAPGPRDPPLAAETLFTSRRQSAVSLEYHLVRPADPAACLRRRHQTNRSAFDRIDPGLAARASCDRACCLDSRRSHSTPYRVPRSAPTPSRAGWSLHAIPAATGHASRRARRPREKMPLTDFCNRLSRYEHPCGSFDSRVRLPRALAGSLRDDSRLRSWRCLDPGGASLDGDPPASVAIMTLRGLVNAVFEASCLAWRWRRPVLAGAAIDSPSERRRPTAVLSTASRARDSTSDALCRAQLLPRSMPGFR